MNHTEAFEERNKTGIDLADDSCVSYLEKHDIKYERTGFDYKERVGLSDFVKINEYLRGMPDFIVFRSEAIFLECKGFRNTLKLKMCDVDCYRYWDKFQKVWFYFYDCGTKTPYLLSLDRINEVLDDCEIGHYHDNNKPYYILPKGLLEAMTL